MSGFTIKLRGGLSLTSREYACHAHGSFAETVPAPAPASWPCPACSAPAILAMSAPAVHTQFAVSASRGRNDAKPHAYSMDTRSIAEGQSVAEWKAERAAKVWEPERQKRVKALVDG